MRAEAAQADRARAAREAAQRWQAAGVIDAAARTAIEAEYPDDRVRLGPVFRFLVFGFTVLAAGALVGLLALSASPGAEALRGLLLILGIALVALSDVLRGPFRRAQGGLESGAGAMGVIFLAVAVTWWAIDSLHVHRLEGAVAWGTALLLFAAAALRWGSTASAGVAAVSAFGLLSQFEPERALWVALALLAAPVLLHAAEGPRLPPSHRRSCQLAAALALLALYAAVNLHSWDAGWVESLSWDGHHRPEGAPWRGLAAVATAVLPLALTLLGLARRRRLLLDLGLAMIVASLVTMRFYVHVAALWAVLIAAGGVAIAAALLLRRWLHAGPQRERAGFTAEALYDEPASARALELLGTVAARTPGARPGPGEDGFTGQGGRMGGAGASGTF